MKLVIGLGNPESRYKNTRHNVGFYMLDAYAGTQNASFLAKDKFKAAVSELIINQEKVILAKPLTYYNESGESVRLICDFYKVAMSDILVVHDELALPFGTIRTRIGGSDAGNNGIKSVSQHVGPGTARIRVGIYNELRDRIDDADFVLSQFTKKESDTLNTELALKTIVLIDNFIAGEFEHTTHT